MIYIRADSNPVISGGHIMRCAAIARALAEAGEQVCFLTADDNPAGVLEEMGFPFLVLHSDWRDLMTDAETVRDLLRKEKDPILLIDTYSITREYVEYLKPHARIASLGSKREYLGPLDLLINYSTDIDYDFYAASYDSRTRLLLGPAFAPLRAEFQNVIPRFRERAGRILLTTGNTDPGHTVPTLLRELLPVLEDRGAAVDAVIGRMFEDREELHRLYDGSPSVTLHENVTSMSALMRQCDLAVSANGTTVYELSAMGLPTVSFAIVPEQVRSALALSGLGAVDYCGRAYEEGEECIRRIVRRTAYYLDNSPARAALAERAHSLIDGNGCGKIGEALLSLRAPA